MRNMKKFTRHHGAKEKHSDFFLLRLLRKVFSPQFGVHLLFPFTSAVFWSSSITFPQSVQTNIRSPSILLTDLLHRRRCGRTVSLFTHFNPVPNLKMRGTIH